MSDTKKSTPARGRPRSFDPEAALAVAERLFHEKGYDGVGVAELGAAMGVNAPSLYAAFGSKRGLFERALEHYSAGPGAMLYAELDGPEPLAVRLARFLRHAARRYTDPADPPGCLLLTALRTCAEPGARAAAEAIAERAAARLRAAIAADRPDLAEALTGDMRVALNGLSAGARDGMDEAALRHAADTFAAGIVARLSGVAGGGASP